MYPIVSNDSLFTLTFISTRYDNECTLGDKMDMLEGLPTFTIIETISMASIFSHAHLGHTSSFGDLV